MNNILPSNIFGVKEAETKKFFSNFYSMPMSVSDDVNNAIVTYFEKQTGDEESARILSRAVLNTAEQQGDDPLVILDEFRKMPMGELNAFLALYLNVSRVNTSLLGVKTTVVSNKYVSRTILP